MRISIYFSKLSISIKHCYFLFPIFNSYLLTEAAKSEEKSKPTEEQAATKIQAVFRGHQTRKSMSMKAVQKQTEPEPSKAELEAEFRADDKGKFNEKNIKMVKNVLLFFRHDKN